MASNTPLPGAESRMLTANSAAALLSAVDYVLLDIDGVLWSGDHVFEGAAETLEWLRSVGKNIRFLSNNSTMSRESTAKKFVKKGFIGVTAAEIYTSGYAAAQYLKHLNSGRTDSSSLLDANVFIVGEAGLHEEIGKVLSPGRFTYGLELNGVEYEPNRMAQALTQRVLPPPRHLVGSCTTPQTSIEELDCSVVVAGLDLHFNMTKLACAGLCFQQARYTQSIGGTLAHDDKNKKKEDDEKPLLIATHQNSTMRFVATNEDPQFPVGGDGVLLPGAGCIVNSVSTVAGRRPDVVCGKPHINLAKILFEVEGIKDPKRCLMIGDRLSTDIAFGNGAGCRTMMVLTGCETRAHVDEEAKRGHAMMLPDYIAPSLAALWMQGNRQIAKL
mmetsp:Transcript_59984/g.69462  ORF Transcript_59984/g.69462 Transcript_59984/m.69462 type:complete len:386 (+) Transcript_59984:55-1212(+)